MKETILKIIERLLNTPVGEQIYAQEIKLLFKLLEEYD